MRAYPKLRAKMKEHETEQAVLAELLEISSSFFNKKINGKSDFTMTEMYSICRELDIPESEVGDYFNLTEKSGKLSEKLSKASVFQLDLTKLSKSARSALIEAIYENR